MSSSEMSFWEAQAFCRNRATKTAKVDTRERQLDGLYIAMSK